MATERAVQMPSYMENSHKERVNKLHKDPLLPQVYRLLKKENRKAQITQ
jgi:hypothetical protein